MQQRETVPPSKAIETTAAVSTCCILPELKHIWHYCYVHLLFKDLSTGSILQDFKMQHDLGEAEPINLLIMSMKKQRILGHFSLRLPDANTKHEAQ